MITQETIYVVCYLLGAMAAIIGFCIGTLSDYNKEIKYLKKFLLERTLIQDYEDWKTLRKDKIKSITP